MFGKGLRLYKREKLCSVTAIDRLFAARTSRGAVVTDRWGRVGSELAYPLRMVYGESDRGGAPVKFLISVPKKKIRHAVDRATVRRRVREAYRLCRGPVETLQPQRRQLDVAFVYVAEKVCSYARIHAAMLKLMAALHAFAASASSSETGDAPQHAADR